MTLSTGNCLKEKTLRRCDDLKRRPDFIVNEKEGVWQVSFLYSVYNVLCNIQGQFAIFAIIEARFAGDCGSTPSVGKWKRGRV